MNAHIVWALDTCPAYVLHLWVERHIRDQDDLVMPKEKAWKGVSAHHVQNKLQR